MESMILTPIFVITTGLAVLGAAWVQRRSRRQMEKTSKTLRPVRVRADRRR